MKAILRKGAVACVAMLMGANAMAQSFDLVRSFVDTPINMLMAGSLFNDNESRMMFRICDEEGFVTKKELYDKNLNLDKEITFDPLFEKVEQYCIYEEPKTLKVLEVLVDTNSHYEADRFFLGDVIYPFYENFLPDIEPDPHYTYIMRYQNMIMDGWSDAKIRGYVEEFIKEWYIEVDYNGERLLFEKHNVLEPEKWGMKYPKQGYFYRDHDEIYSVIFRYAADEWQEMSRESYYTYQPSADFVLYCDNEIAVMNAYCSQGFFNTDDKYEFVIPELTEVGDTCIYYSHYNIHDIEYPYTTTVQMTIEREREIRVSYDKMGYKVIAEDGNLLFKTEMDPSRSCCLMGYLWAEKKYLTVISSKRISDGYGGWKSGETMTQFYEIKADGNNTAIQKVREMRGGMNIRPTIANRDEQFTITLNDENSSAARELIITGVNGQLIERRNIPAGEKTVTVSATMMRSGMYNFTLQKKGQVVDNGKVIVK